MTVIWKQSKGLSELGKVSHTPGMVMNGISRYGICSFSSLKPFLHSCAQVDVLK